MGRSLARAGRRLLLLDFDGTLAPLDPDPGAVRLPVRAEEALLLWRGAPDTTVAVVSGRSLEDLRSRIPPFVVAVGSHGRESDLWADEAPSFPAEGVRAWAAGRLGGLEVAWQHKPHGLGINLRGLDPAPRAEAARRLQETCPVPGVKTLMGRMMVEYVAEGAPDKGTAARRLKDRFGVPAEGILAIGDDTTDEDMFRALPDALRVHVGDGPSLAPYALRDPGDVQDFLYALHRAFTHAMKSGG